MDAATLLPSKGSLELLLAVRCFLFFSVEILRNKSRLPPESNLVPNETKPAKAGFLKQQALACYFTSSHLPWAGGRGKGFGKGFLQSLFVAPKHKIFTEPF